MVVTVHTLECLIIVPMNIHICIGERESVVIFPTMAVLRYKDKENALLFMPLFYFCTVTKIFVVRIYSVVCSKACVIHLRCKF